MTLLGVMDLGPRILMGADSSVLAGNPQVYVPTKKAFRLSQLPSVGWGFAGAQPVGLSFQRWIDGQTFRDWDTLQGMASAALATFNGNGRAAADVARAENFEPVECLVAGFVAGEARVVYLDDEGLSSQPTGTPFFLGGGGPGAYIAWEAISRAVPPSEFDKESAFRMALDSVPARMPAIGGPIEIIELADTP